MWGYTHDETGDAIGKGEPPKKKITSTNSDNVGLQSSRDAKTTPPISIIIIALS